MTDILQERIAARVACRDESAHRARRRDAEMVRDIATTTDGRVRLTLLLPRGRPGARCVRTVRQALEHVDGVTDVRVDVKDASQAEHAGRRRTARRRRRRRAARTLPVMGQEPQSRRAAVPRPTPVAYPNLGRVIAVSSGKGGVGKSTVADEPRRRARASAARASASWTPTSTDRTSRA